MSSFRTTALIVGVGLLGVASGWTVATVQSATAEPAAKARLYELRTYTTLPGRLPALHARFRDHTAKLFEKHGMKNGMYWTPTDEKKKDNTLIYVVSHEDAPSAKKSWADFIADPAWHAARDASEKDGKIVEKVESVYMELTDYSPVKE